MNENWASILEQHLAALLVAWITPEMLEPRCELGLSGTARWSAILFQAVTQLLNGAVACSGPLYTVMLFHTAVLSSGMHIGAD
jgi:hypothetical protein